MLFSVGQEGLYPFQGLVAYSIVLQFLQQALVGNSVKSLGEVKQNYIYLVPQDQVLSDGMHSD